MRWPAPIWIACARSIRATPISIVSIPWARSRTRHAQLKQAGKLAEAGQYAQAMAIYRQVFRQCSARRRLGAGRTTRRSPRLADGRAHAIAGLRGLMAKYPSDSRYQIALGRILTYDPKTRAEGRQLLETPPQRSAGDRSAAPVAGVGLRQPCECSGDSRIPRQASRCAVGDGVTQSAQAGCRPPQHRRLLRRLLPGRQHVRAASRSRRRTTP